MFGFWRDFLKVLKPDKVEWILYYRTQNTEIKNKNKNNRETRFYKLGNAVCSQAKFVTKNAINFNHDLTKSYIKSPYSENMCVNTKSINRVGGSIAL